MHMHVRPRFLTALALVCLLAAIWVTPATAQTGPTRSTPCSPTTAWNAVCLMGVAPSTYTDGLAIPSGTTFSYRVENRLGTSGDYATVSHTGPVTAMHVQGLAAGVHYFRVYATVQGGAESGPSNVVNRGLSTGVPTAPVITIAMLIQPGNDPVVVELTARRDGDYRCRVVASPPRLKLRTACQAEVGG
jgi:hypothetical protein